MYTYIRKTCDNQNVVEAEWQKRIQRKLMRQNDWLEGKNIKFGYYDVFTHKVLLKLLEINKIYKWKQI